MKTNTIKIILTTSLATAMLVGITAINRVNAYQEVLFIGQESSQPAGCQVTRPYDGCTTPQGPLPLPCTPGTKLINCTQAGWGWECKAAARGERGMTECEFIESTKRDCPMTNRYRMCMADSSGVTNWYTVIGTSTSCGKYYAGANLHGEVCIGE